jgi:glycosyltransferase involved in cell wall biosynthesis
MTRAKVAIVAVGSGTGEIGGVERLYTGLQSALENCGLQAEIVSQVSDESNFEQIKRSYLGFYDLSLNAFDGVVSTKAPSFAVRHRNHVGYLVHTMRVFYDMFETEFPTPSASLLEQRRLIHQLDTAALSPRRLKHLYTVGHEVKERLKQYNGIDAEALHHPTTLHGLTQGKYDYILLPGRLHRWKRVDLVISAIKLVRQPVQLLITGTGEDRAYFETVADGDPRIRFLGRVSEEQLRALYADALAVAFVPKREDLGLITLEAFGSGKPVITCTDSGEPSRLVRHGETGFVSQPEPPALAGWLERLIENPEMAMAMGNRGRSSVMHITWERIGQNLARALGFVDSSSSQ